MRIGTYFKVRVIAILAVLFIGGIVLTVNGIKDTSALSKDIPDFNEMHEYEFKEGMFVDGYIPLCYGNFAYEYEDDDDHSTVEYYLIPLLEDCGNNSYKYIVVSVTNSQQMTMMNKIIDQTDDFIDDSSLEYDDIDWEDFYFIGQVRELDPEIEDFLYEYYVEAGWYESDSRELFNEEIVSLDLRYREPSSVSASLDIGIVMMIIPIIVVVVIVIVYNKKKNNGMYAGETQFNYNGQNMNNGFGQQNANQFTTYSGINSTPNNGFNQNNFNPQGNQNNFNQQGNLNNQYTSANNGQNQFKNPQNYAGNTQHNFNTPQNNGFNANQQNTFNSSNNGFNNTSQQNPFNSGNQQFGSQNNNGFSNSGSTKSFNSGNQQFGTQNNQTNSMDELDTSKIDHTKL